MRLKKYIHFNIAKLEVKADLPGEYPAGYIEGYASVFNNVDNGGEIVVKGAFTKTIKERLKTGFIKLMDNHKVWEGTDAVIGVVTDAKEDDYGLWFRAKLSSVQRAQDIRVKLQEGILNALSFGYDVVRHEIDDAKKIIYLKELKLFEVSVVVWGMNDKAAVTAAKGLDGVEIPLGFDGYIQGAPEEELSSPAPEPEAVKQDPAPAIIPPSGDGLDDLFDPSPEQVEASPDDIKNFLADIQLAAFQTDMRTTLRQLTYKP